MKSITFLLGRGIMAVSLALSLALPVFAQSSLNSGGALNSVGMKPNQKEAMKACVTQYREAIKNANQFFHENIKSANEAFKLAVNQARKNIENKTNDKAGKKTARDAFEKAVKSAHAKLSEARKSARQTFINGKKTSADAYKACKSAATSTANPENKIISIRQVQLSPALGGEGVEIELSSKREFPVRNEIVVLRIGNYEFTLSRYPESGDIHRLIFTLSSKQFAQVVSGDPVKVYYGLGGESGAGDVWNFGRLNKRFGTLATDDPRSFHRSE